MAHSKIYLNGKLKNITLPIINDEILKKQLKKLSPEIYERKTGFCSSCLKQRQLEELSKVKNTRNKKICKLCLHIESVKKRRTNGEIL